MDFETIGPDGYAGVEDQLGPMEQSFIRGSVDEPVEAEMGRDWNEPGGGDYTQVDALQGQEWQTNAAGEKPGVQFQGKAIAEFMGSDWWMLMLPDGSISEQSSATDVVRVVKKFFAKIGTDTNIGVGTIEWRDVPEGFIPPTLGASRRTSAHEEPEACEYGPDCYGVLSDDAEPVGEEEIPVAAIRGSAIKKEWPSVDEEAVQHFLSLWATGEYDDTKPVEVFLVDGDYWVWDGHSRFVMHQRVNPNGTILCNVVERFSEVGRQASRKAVHIVGYEPDGSDPDPAVSVETYYSREWKTWVILQKDKNGNQVGDAEYEYRREDAEQRKAELENAIRQQGARQAGALDADMSLVVDGDPADPDDMDGWEMFEKTEPTEMVRMDAPFTVETLEGTMNADAGDFLAVGPEGEMYPIDGDIQEQTYRPVAGRLTAHKNVWEVWSIDKDGVERREGVVDMAGVPAPGEIEEAIWGMGPIPFSGGIYIEEGDGEIYIYDGPEHDADQQVGFIVRAGRNDGGWENRPFYSIKQLFDWQPKDLIGMMLECPDGEFVQVESVFEDGVMTDNGEFIQSHQLPLYKDGDPEGRQERIDRLYPRSRKDGRTADNSPTGMFSWEGGQPDPFPADDDSMPNSSNPDGVNRNVSTEMGTDQRKPRGASRLAASGFNPIADGLRLARRPVTASRRFGRSRQEVLAAIDELDSFAIPEQVARYRNMVNLDYDPDLILARIEADRPYLQRAY